MDKENVPVACPAGLKRTQPAEEKLPEAFDVPSDSPAQKRSRQSDVRKSRVSFGGVEMRTFCKDKLAKRSPAPPAKESPISVASDLDQFYSPRAQQSGSPTHEATFNTATLTSQVPSLQDILSADELSADDAHLPPDDEGETQPIPKLSDLGDFDDTRCVDTGVMAEEPTDEMNPSTAFIAAGVAHRDSMAFDADTATVEAPSLQGLVQRAAEQPGPDDDTGSLDESMEMTGCYGGIVSDSTSKVSIESTAVASDTEAQCIGTKIPHAAELLVTDDTACPDMSACEAPAQQASLAKLSLTPQLQSLMKRKCTTAFVAPSSPQAGDAVTSPALLRAGARLTLTPSGASPFKPMASPHSPAKAMVGLAAMATVRTLALESDNTNKDTAPAPASRITEMDQKRLEKNEHEPNELNMPEDIPDAPLASPSQVSVQKKTLRASMSTSGAVLKDMIRRRSSMQPSSNVSLLPPFPMESDRVHAAATCRTFQQFLDIADIRFLDDLSTNRRNTLLCRQPCKPADTLEECITLSTTSLPELRAMQQGCDVITTMVTETERKISDAEKSAQSSPPSLFKELADDTRSEACTLLRGKLATLKRNCRKEGKYEWYTWYKTIVKNMAEEAAIEGNRLVDEATHLATRAAEYAAAEQKLCKYMLDLGVQPLDGRQPVRTEEDILQVQQLESSVEQRTKEINDLKEQVVSWSTTYRELEARTERLGGSISTLEEENANLMLRAQAASVASLDGVQSALDRYTTLLDVEGLTIQKLSYDMIILDLCQCHRVTVFCDGDIVTEARLQHFNTASSEVDEFQRGLIEDAELDVLVSKLCGQSRKMLPKILNELNFRLGRCNDLVAEVDSIQRNLKLLVARGRGCIEVTISNFLRNRKLKISFTELHYGFPFGDVCVEITHCVGDLHQEALQDVIRRQRSGQYGRLFNICEGVAELVCR